MSTATVTSKGQITLPKELREELREELGLEAGSAVAFIRESEGVWRIAPSAGSVCGLIGILHDPNRSPMSIEEMNEAIADGWAANGMRDREAGAAETEPCPGALR